MFIACKLPSFLPGTNLCPHRINLAAIRPREKQSVRVEVGLGIGAWSEVRRHIAFEGLKGVQSGEDGVGSPQRFELRQGRAADIGLIDGLGIRLPVVCQDTVSSRFRESRDDTTSGEAVRKSPPTSPRFFHRLPDQRQQLTLVAKVRNKLVEHVIRRVGGGVGTCPVDWEIRRNGR